MREVREEAFDDDDVWPGLAGNRADISYVALWLVSNY